MKQRQALRMGPLVKKETTYNSLIPLEEWLTYTATGEACFDEGKQKLVGLGWGEERLGEGGLGWGLKRTGEGLPAKLVERYSRRHRDVLNSHLAGVDKDKMTEGELRKLICAMESGAKVVSVPTADGKSKLCVSVLTLGPNTVRSTITAEKRETPGEITAAATSQGGVEVKVNISQIFISQYQDFKACYYVFTQRILPGTGN